MIGGADGIYHLSIQVAFPCLNSTISVSRTCTTITFSTFYHYRKTNLLQSSCMDFVNQDTIDSAHHWRTWTPIPRKAPSEQSLLHYSKTYPTLLLLFPLRLENHSSRQGLFHLSARLCTRPEETGSTPHTCIVATRLCGPFPHWWCCPTLFFSLSYFFSSYVLLLFLLRPDQPTNPVFFLCMCVCVQFLHCRLYVICVIWNLTGFLCAADGRVVCGAV